MGETRHGPGEDPGEQRPGCGWSANQREQVHVLKAKAALLSWWPLQPLLFLLTSYSNLVVKGKACLGCPSTEANQEGKKEAGALG